MIEVVRGAARLKTSCWACLRCTTTVTSSSSLRPWSSAAMTFKAVTLGDPRPCPASNSMRALAPAPPAAVGLVACCFDTAACSVCASAATSAGSAAPEGAFSPSGRGQWAMPKASHSSSTRATPMPTIAASAGDPSSAKRNDGIGMPNSFHWRMRLTSAATTPVPITVRDTPAS